MQEDMDGDNANQATKQAPQAPQAPIQILAQYVRDLSFENPGAPGSLRGGAEPPQMDINIGMDARKLPDAAGAENLYETVLNIRAIAMQGEDPLFIAELQYAATVAIEGVPEENHHPILLMEVPRLIFPFARQIVSDLTIQGGFPPLMLSPVDFHAIYMERFRGEIEKKAGQGESIQ